MMKKTYLFVQYVICLLTLSLLVACEEEGPTKRIEYTAGKARVKFIHAIPAGPGVNVYVNDQKINAAAAAASGAVVPLAYGGVFPATDYSAVDPGTASIRVVVPAAAGTPEATLLAADLDLQADTYYSIFATGSTDSPAPLVIEDNFTVEDPTKFYVRFVNLMPNSTSLSLNIASGATLATNLSYQSASGFIAVAPTATSGVYTLQLKSEGATATVATLSNASLLAGKVYTVMAQGRIGGSAAARTVPTLVLTTNK